MYGIFPRASYPSALLSIPLLFTIPPVSKIGHPHCKKKRILNVGEIMKLLQYNHHPMNSIADISVANSLKNLFSNH